jgi:hypothetical protein
MIDLWVPPKPAIIRASDLREIDKGIFFTPPAFLKAASVALETATWDPANKTLQAVLSNGNLTVSIGNFGAQGARGTNLKSSGKWYFEFTLVTFTGEGSIGVGSTSHSVSGLVGGDAHSGGYYMHPTASGVVANGFGTYDTTVPDPVAGDIVGIAVNVSSHLLWVRLNGTWLRAGADPVAGTGSTNYITTAAVYPQMSGVNISGTLNTGGTPFAHAIPSGFRAWHEVP